MVRTYIYKLTSDRGGAPSAPPPRPGELPLLSLSICKPAIRRTAKPGDRILGITSRSLVEREGYPLHAIIYAAVVGEAVDARDYYAARSPFRYRPDCIYKFHRLNGTIEHTGDSPLHADEAYRARDIGQYPFYKNGRTLLSHEFRYFGRAALPIPPKLYRLQGVAESLGQGHRVFGSADPEHRETNSHQLFLMTKDSLQSPSTVKDESNGHVPGRRKPIPAVRKTVQIPR